MSCIHLTTKGAMHLTTKGASLFDQQPIGIDDQQTLLQFLWVLIMIHTQVQHWPASSIGCRNTMGTVPFSILQEKQKVLIVSFVVCDSNVRPCSS